MLAAPFREDEPAGTAAPLGGRSFRLRATALLQGWRLVIRGVAVAVIVVVIVHRGRAAGVEFVVVVVDRFDLFAASRAGQVVRVTRW